MQERQPRQPNFAAEIVGRMQERQPFVFLVVLQFTMPQTTSKYLMRCSWVVMYTVLSTLRFLGPTSAISSFIVYILQISSKKVTMAELECSAVVTMRVRVRTLLVSIIWVEFLLLRVAWASSLFASSEGYMCDWQVAYERISFTAVPQTDWKHFNLELSLGKAWLPGKWSLGGLDALPDPHSHG